MKVEFFYEKGSPLLDAQMCVLGFWTLREKGSWFQIALGFLFFTVGLHFGEPIGLEKYATCPKCGNQHMIYDTNCDPIYYCQKCDHAYEQKEIVYRTKQ